MGSVSKSSSNSKMKQQQQRKDKDKDRLGRNKERAAPLKVVHISNPTMVKASVSDFKATVQHYTGRNASCDPDAAAAFCTSSSSSSSYIGNETKFPNLRPPSPPPPQLQLPEPLHEQHYFPLMEDSNPNSNLGFPEHDDDVYEFCNFQELLSSAAFSDLPPRSCSF